MKIVHASRDGSTYIRDSSLLAAHENAAGEKRIEVQAYGREVYVVDDATFARAVAILEGEPTGLSEEELARLIDKRDAKIARLERALAKIEAWLWAREVRVVSSQVILDNSRAEPKRREAAR